MFIKVCAESEPARANHEPARANHEPARANQNNRPFRDFFLGKKENLAQSLVDGAIKAVFSGIIVAVASLYIVGAVDASIERSEKRAALQDFQNSILSDTLSAASASIRDLNCARNVYKLKGPDCENQLDELVGVLQVQSDLLKALFPDSEFSSIDNLIETARQLKAVNEDTPIDTSVVKLTEKFSTDFRTMINKVAQHFE